MKSWITSPGGATAFTRTTSSASRKPRLRRSMATPPDGRASTGSDGTAAARLQLQPFRDPAGNVTGVVGIAVDITDRVRREAEVRAGQRLLRQVLETLPVGVVVLDRAGDIMLGNPAADHIWGGTIVSGRERWVKSKGYWHASGQAIDPREWASRHALDEGRTSRDELIDI